MELISVLTSLAVNITSTTNAYCHVYSDETPVDGQLICPKHVEFFIKINEKQCILLTFIIQTYHDVRSSECKNRVEVLQITGHVSRTGQNHSLYLDQ